MPPKENGLVVLGRMDGGAERDRTADLVIANDALSQLSYSPSSGIGPLALTFDQGNGLATRRFHLKT